MSRTYGRFCYLEAKMLYGGFQLRQNTAKSLIQGRIWDELGAGHLNYLSFTGYIDQPLPLEARSPRLHR
ncbi:MAG TPA: hypothetical protein IGS52_24470 [Oscillatoriaceae cyanobacterium M33_DOE_052]|uniref:Uncharacterized protein n=1 Tax=Planktothricoides sp. SpSt-374 TaxID=2282167 RepID=A0A7C3ZGR2_9CYAN|nr:hypothetical protein [Oscillatoriaceae cyanobacterium M33_DOE_052]